MELVLLFVSLFRILCVVAAGFMVGYWIYKYHNNEDMTLIEYKSFTLSDDTLYPEFTLCVWDPFMDAKFNYTNRVTKESYLQYLNGSISVNDSLTNVRFDSVTVNLFEYLNHVDIGMKVGDKDISHRCTNTTVCSFINFRNNFNGFAILGFLKCFGFEINRRYSSNISYVSMRFKNTLPDVLKQVGKVYAMFNYPNQLLRKVWDPKQIWNDPTNDKLTTHFPIYSMEILRRRNKKANPCFEDWRYFDKSVIQENMEIVRCTAPYRLSDHRFPVCNTQTQMNDSSVSMSKMAHNFAPPCQEISYFSFKHHLRQEPGYGRFLVTVDYPDRAKIITQSQAINIHALIGNIGGYVGLFLGRLKSINTEGIYDIKFF